MVREKVVWGVGQQLEIGERQEGVRNCGLHWCCLRCDGGELEVRQGLGLEPQH